MNYFSDDGGENNMLRMIRGCRVPDPGALEEGFEQIFQCIFMQEFLLQFYQTMQSLWLI